MSRVAVVTGAASGMGKGIAVGLAAAGHRVALLDRQGELVRTASQEIAASGAEATAHEVDVSNWEDVRHALDDVRARWGPITIMVTAAGITGYTDVTAITREEWDKYLAINLTGTFGCVQAVVPDMVETGWGRVVMISSTSAQTGSSKQAHYSASKGGVMALTKTLAMELSPRGITVNNIPPSIVDTPMVQVGMASGNFPGLEAIAAITPVRRTGYVEDIAAATTFLCSDDAGFITGQSINVNGGLYM